MMQNVAKNRKSNKNGPNKQAARAARQRREQRLLEINPLFHGSPPYEGYREWLLPNPLTGKFDLHSNAPMESRLYFARIEDLLLPLYRGKVPMAATYLDDRIKSGVIVLADDDGPDAHVTVLPVTEFARQVGHDDGQGHQEVCPRLNCAGSTHVEDEHRVWVHLHHLHAAGSLLINDRDAIRLTVPPNNAGDSWQFVATGQCR
ncbi:hypothetical protein [Streptomyces lunaelactis]|uniref:hypothetical protein n=1 Tax=Streptomyces lunaelactis TaxID=1535768 RepID=UPI0015855A54|nr:hypothetical protein [Streptomyces lunaelactis]NUK23705.1 hypothetical protein [Streptomyces lunaelactis]